MSTKAEYKRYFDWRKGILDSDLKPTTRHVLHVIACHVNAAEETCFPSVKQLARETGLDRKAVMKHLALAIKAGWIRASRHGFGGQAWKRAEYAIAWPDAAPPEAERGPPGGPGSPEGGPFYGPNAVPHGDHQDNSSENSPESPPLSFGEHPPTGGATRGTRLPADWTLPPSWREWAIAQGFGMKLDIDNEAAVFRDYWIAVTGQRATKRDWFAVWRNWLRNEVKRGNRNRQAQRPDPYAGTQGFVDAAARYIARQADRPDDGG